jgi:hypothetical protein
VTGPFTLVIDVHGNPFLNRMPQTNPETGAYPLRARQKGRSRSPTVTHGEIAAAAQVSYLAGERRSLVATSQAGGAEARRTPVRHVHAPRS